MILKVIAQPFPSPLPRSDLPVRDPRPRDLETYAAFFALDC